MPDREIVERLAHELMHWHRSRDGYKWLDANGDKAGDVDDWFPPESLDDCRIVEDKIREMGLVDRYIDELQCEVFMFQSELPEDERLAYASPRSRCLAMLRVIESR